VPDDFRAARAARLAREQHAEAERFKTTRQHCGLSRLASALAALERDEFSSHTKVSVGKVPRAVGVDCVIEFAVPRVAKAFKRRGGLGLELALADVKGPRTSATVLVTKANFSTEV